MKPSSIQPGKDVPNDINVIIEISANSEPVKYEVDKDTGLLNVDRFVSTAMFYPCNYGYVPNTLSDDGDPVDVLVVAPFSLLPGAVIRCRPVGMLAMEDESGTDAKIIAVPISKLTKMYDHIQTPQDLPRELTAATKHFFEHYKDLEEGKWVKVGDWLQADAAKKEIMVSVERFSEKV